MTWHIRDAQNLSLIDQEVGPHGHAPAHYEIIRRVIYATADLDYLDLLEFSERVLTIAAAGLAARTTILVDVPMVQVGIAPTLQKTFANPVYCSSQTITRPQKQRTPEAWGLINLAHRYPDGIFVLGSSSTALEAMLELVDAQKVQPTLVIATPVDFVQPQDTVKQLRQAKVPHIALRGRKGGATVAVAILNALVDLAWKAYEQKAHLN